MTKKEYKKYSQQKHTKKPPEDSTQYTTNEQN